MVQSIRFRGDDDDNDRLKRDAKAAGFKANVSAYIRHKLGLPAAVRGRPPTPKPAKAKKPAKPRPRTPRGEK